MPPWGFAFETNKAQSDHVLVFEEFSGFLAWGRIRISQAVATTKKGTEPGSPDSTMPNLQLAGFVPNYVAATVAFSL